MSETTAETTQSATKAETVEPHGTTTEQTVTEPATGKEDTTDWKAEARKWETRAKENGNAAKTAAEKASEKARAEVAREFAEKLGLVETTDTPTMETLSAQLAEQAEKVTTAEARADAAERKLAVFLNAGDADPARVLRDVDFLTSVKDIDPSDTEALKAALAKAVTDAPWLRKNAATGASSVDHPGGSGEGAAKPTNLEDAIAQKMAR